MSAISVHRILVADDHTLLRAGLVKLLESMRGVVVVGQAGDGEQVLEAAKQLQPDLVLLDIAMPKRNGLEVCGELVKRHAGIKVLMLSMHQEHQYVRKALQNGAAGYLLKDSAPDELSAAISALIQGQTYLSPTLEKAMVGSLVQGLTGNEPSDGAITPRQQEVLKLVAEGLSTKEIARAMNLSVKTVDSHRSNLMNQLNIHDLAGLVRYAIRNGIATSGH
jgi:DNA-binding NarL/FixJ family response regulator